ncbi:tail fiber assembly protein [Citrobacter sp. Awk 4]|uniref:tail fiber assembly protein n=1 Tax=Citrobacter sp. Awk 4 TaxID=2963955 RepID=UPI00230245D1|nr:tail fiber assembly protein [Citrobacter sp. Awk 4]MDA8478503.1 tail fiber assembly protein [Citrobacter sp. Awk 4]
MSNYIYSPSQNMIIPVGLKQHYVDAGTWPDDAVNISDSQAAEFNQQFPEGKILSHDENSQPCWADAPPPTYDELLATAEFDKQRRINEANSYMNERQWPGKAAIGRLKEDDLKRYNLWLDYLDALEAVDTSEPQKIIWPATPED